MLERRFVHVPPPHGFSDDEADKITSLDHGAEHDTGYAEAARKADAVLFLISPWTLQSKFQAEELAIGLSNGRVVPCIVHDDVQFSQMPDGL